MTAILSGLGAAIAASKWSGIPMENGPYAVRMGDETVQPHGCMIDVKDHHAR
ncbi:MAG: hypothetical protein ACKOPR_10055 [Chakrabartia godavariana]